MDWNIFEYPCLQWRWRAEAFPVGADLLEDSRSDAAAQIYVVWKGFFSTRVLKFFWAAGNPPGTELKQSNFFGRLYGEVVRTRGATHVWQREERNILQVFRKAFASEPSAEVSAIAVLSDADDTHSQSEADYADFSISKCGEK